MNLLIRGANMPKNCAVCPLERDVFGCAVCCGKADGDRIGTPIYEADLPSTDFEERRPSWCPLVKVPPYTRLIDAETLYCRLVNEPIRAVDGVPYDADWWTRIADAYEQAIDAVEQAPTIIEAEEEENEKIN